MIVGTLSDHPHHNDFGVVGFRALLCPIVIVPNFVPSTPPAPEIGRLRSIIEGTPVQVAPPIPTALHVGTRKKRIAITAETPPAKSLQRVAAALENLATFVKGYVNG